MKSENGRVLVLLLAVVTTVAAVEAVVLFQMETRLSTIEERNPSGTADENGPEPLALGKEVREMGETLDVMTRTQGFLRERAESFDTRLSLIEREATGALAEGLRTADGSPGVSAEAMEAAVAKAVEEKVKEMPRGEGGEWKPTMQEMRDALEMTEEQTTASETVIDDAKHEVYELVRLRRLDGSSIMDDMADAVQSDDPEAGMKQVFRKLCWPSAAGRCGPTSSITESFRSSRCPRWRPSRCAARPSGAPPATRFR